MVAMPIAFAFSEFVIHRPQFSTFAAFGSFALLVFSDFGGRPSRRARAYLVTTAVGLGLVALGTACQPNAVASVVAMAVVAALVSFLGLLGGYTASAGLTLILAFVLSVSVDNRSGAYGERLGGWALAGIIATVAALVLWPQRERHDFRRACGSVARKLAEAMTRRSAGLDATAASDGVRHGLEDLDNVAGASLYRPAGPTLHDRALAGLRDQLRRIRRTVERVAVAETTQDRELVQATATTLEVMADALDDDDARVIGPGVTTLVEARDAHRVAIEAEVEGAENVGATDDASVATVLDTLASSLPIRLAAYSTLVAATDAATALGTPLASDPSGGAAVPASEARSGLAPATVSTLRANLHTSSVWTHNALRAGLALALAVLVARIGHVQNGFWVALGTVSVLRSNALGTGRNAASALIGSVIGFALAAPFVTIVGGNSVVLWIALPVTIFVSAYTPTVVHFVVGQASFTVMVVVLFNLIEPIGWRIGLVRIQDVAIGCAVSVVVVLLMWPRGARAQLRGAVEDQYLATAAYLATAFRTVLGLNTDAEAVDGRGTSVAAASRAGEAWQQYLAERSSKVEPPALWSDLVSSGRQLHSQAAALLRLTPLPPEDGAEPEFPAAAQAREALARDADVMVAACTRVAAEVGRGVPLHSVRNPAPVGDDRRRTLTALVAECRAADFGIGGSGGRREVDPPAVLTLLWAGELTDYCTRILADLPDPARIGAASSE